MKKTSMGIVLALIISSFPIINAEDNNDLFKQYGVSPLAAIINQDFSDYAVGTTAEAIGFKSGGVEIQSKVMEENGNKYLAMQTYNQGDGFIELKYNAKGIVLAQVDIFVDNIQSYAQLPNLVGANREGMPSIGAFVSLDGKLAVSYTNATANQTLKQSKWVTFGIVADTVNKTSDFYIDGVNIVKGQQFYSDVEEMTTIRFMLRGLGNKVHVDNIKIGVSDILPKKAEEVVDNRPNLAYPAEILNASQEEQAAQSQAFRDVEEQLRQAIGRGDKEFVIPKGIYRSGTTDGRFKVIGATDMVIEGSGATILSETRNNNLHVENCKNVTIKNLVLDSSSLYFTQGVVIGIDKEKRTVDILIDNGYTVPGTNYVGERVMFFSPDGTIPLRAALNDRIAALQPIAPKTIRISQTGLTVFAPESIDSLVEGVRAAFPLRGGGSGLAVLSSEKCTFENLSIYSAPGFGARESSGEGGHTYDNLKIIRRPDSNRLISVAADGFHSLQVKNGPTIINSEIAHAEDDLLNIQGFMDVIYRKINDTTYYVSATFGIGFSEGSLIEFYDVVKLKKIDEAKVVSISTDVPASVAPNVAKIASTLSEQTGVRIREPMPGLMLKVEFDRPIKVKPYDVMFYYDTCGAGAVIKNSYFHDGFIRALYIRSAATIENNIIERISASGVLINTDIYWLEGPNARDVVINNNKFIDCGRGSDGVIGAIAIGTQVRTGTKPFKINHYENITITNNEFVRSGGNAITMTNTKGAYIANNTIENSWDFPIRKPVNLFGFQGAYASVYINNSNDIVVENNQIKNTPDWVEDIVNLSK